MRIKDYLSAALLLFTLAISSLSFAESDSFITLQVKSEIHDEIPLQVDVTTWRGVVKLTGNVDSNESAAALTEIAQSVPGVRDVDTSQLLVNGKHLVSSDEMTTARVRGVLIQNDVFGDHDIDDMDLSIETHKGIVTITGTVDTPEESYMVRTLTMTVPGVVAVKTNLKIS